MPYVSGEDAVKELRRTLSNPNVQSDPLRYRSSITKVIRVMSQGVDVSALFPEMVKACATVDIVQKKLVYVFLCSYASLNPQLSLLVINTLRKDCEDSNPMVRSLALRNMTNLRLPGLAEYVQQPLTLGLRDRAACVRRVAVLGFAKLHNLHPQAEIDPAVVNELYSLLRDSDPVVMVNCLRALEDILKDEGGVAINRNITHHLLNRLKECDVWGQCDVLRILERYRPQTEGELFDILSLLDSSLTSALPAVMAATLRLFLCLTSSLPAVCQSALERALCPLLAACGSSSREMRFTALAHVQLVMQSVPGLLGAHYKRFFCGYAEPAYIKQRKMQVLVELANDENVSLLLDELKGYCTDVDPDTAQAAISAIGRIGRSYSDESLEILTCLLGLRQEHITSAVVQTFRDLVWMNPHCSEAVCHAIEGCEETLQDEQGRKALLWLLGAFGERVSSAPYVLESFIDGVRGEASVSVKLELLTTTLRLFLSRPAETQDMLGRLLTHCIEDEGDMSVRDQALLYYSLLHRGAEEARRVVEGRSFDPALGVLINRTLAPVEAWAHSFNTLQPLYPMALTATTPGSSCRESPQRLTNSLPKPRPILEECKVTGAAESCMEPVGSAMEPVGGTGQPVGGAGQPVEGVEHVTVSLSLTPVLSPEQFEETWLKNQDRGDDGESFLCVDKLLHVRSIPAASPQNLQVALQLVNVQTMAFTPRNALPWRVYLYTHGRSEGAATSSLILAELTEERAELTEEKAELMEERAELMEKRAELMERRAELTEERVGLAEERAELTEEKAELMEERAELMEKRAELMERRAELMERRAELTEERVGLTEERAELTEKRAGLTEERAELTEERVELTEERAELTEKRAELTEKRAELTEEKAELMEERAELMEKRAELTEERVGLTEERAELTEEEAELMEKRAELTEERVGLTEERAELTEEEAELTAEITKPINQMRVLIGEARGGLPEDAHRQSPPGGESGQRCVKVKVKQKPRDGAALRMFFCVLNAVLDTLSAEGHL